MDMMLDTITNAFGGIVLLALLVTLILGQQKIHPATLDSNAVGEVAGRLERDLQQRAFERDQLAQSVEDQRNQLLTFQDDDASGLIAELMELQNREQQLNEQLGNDHQKLADFQSEIDSLAQSLNKVRKQVATAGEDLANVNAKLAEEKKRRTRSMDTPREAVTYKSMVLVLIKNSQLHVADRNFGTQAFQINQNQFEACDKSKADLVMASPHGPVRIRPNTGSPLSDVGEIERQLSRISASESYLAIVVWNDSFDDFGNLRTVCVSLGLEHKLFPIAAGPVVEGRSASTSTAQ